MGMEQTRAHLDLDFVLLTQDTYAIPQGRALQGQIIRGCLL